MLFLIFEKKLKIRHLQEFIYFFHACIFWELRIKNFTLKFKISLLKIKFQHSLKMTSFCYHILYLWRVFIILNLV